MTAVTHPCRYTTAVLDEIAGLLNGEAFAQGLNRLAVIDPFAGTGERVYRHKTFTEHVWCGLELEESFIAAPWVMPGNALNIPFGARSFHAYATSFVFPNRMTDTFVTAEGSPHTYMTYRHAAAANHQQRTYQLHQANAGGMRWGDAYRAFHSRAIAEGIRVLGQGGLFVVEMKDHLVKGECVHVTDWFCEEFRRQRCGICGTIDVPVTGNRKGSAGSRDQRVDHSTIIVARVTR